MTDKKFGYSTFYDLNQPANRRRFCYYAKQRGIYHTSANPKLDYDIVVVSQSADLSQWQRYPIDRGKIVFDFINSDLNAKRFDPYEIFRGSAKYFFRRNKYLWLNYIKLLKSMCKRADAVVCTTEEQRQSILPFCNNVHIILDFQTNDVQKIKNNYSRREAFNIVWEGLPENLEAFECILDALREVKKRHKIAFHIITDLYRPNRFYNIGKLSTREMINNILGKEDTYLYEWNSIMFSAICTECDLAIIPLDLRSPDNVGKPENKLLLFWRMGIPVVASATPAYLRAMKGAGLTMACSSTEEWVTVLEKYICDETARCIAGQQGKSYAEENYGEEGLLNKWDKVLESITH